MLGVAALLLALGRDDRPLVPRRHERRETLTFPFAPLVDDLGPVLFVTKALLDAHAAALRREGLVAVGLTRREAIWAVGAVEARSDLLPDVPLDLPSLLPLTDEEETQLDYTLMGCAPGNRHLMRFHREQMARWGVVSARDLRDVPHGATVRVGGAVITRQRPGTSKRVVFLTLEDETGVVNVVVMPDLYHAQRSLLRLAPLLAVEGEVQRVDGVTHVQARRVRAFGGNGEAGALRSKHFA